MSEESLCDPQTGNSPVLSGGSSEKSRKNWRKAYDLPPCKVCGAKGTGFHYGVNTCEPCKAFFKRSLDKHPSFKCRKDSRCHIQTTKKNLMCSYCRYNKCLDTGMSLDGIKNGRYTLKKISEDITTVNQLQAREAVTTWMLNEKKFSPSAERLVVTLADARQKHMDTWINYEIRTLELTKLYMETQDIQDTLMCDLLQLERNDIRSSYWQQTMSCTEKLLRLSLKFVKCIPGFRELDIQDQVLLFQGTSGELRAVQALQLTPQLYSLWDSIDWQKVYGEEFDAVGRQIRRVIKRITLTNEEAAVLSAMILFNPDRYPLNNPHHVQELQHEMATTSQWLLRRNHPDDPHLFARIISFFTTLMSDEVRTRDLCSKLVEMDSKDIIKIPPLLKDVIPPAEEKNLKATEPPDAVMSLS